MTITEYPEAPLDYHGEREHRRLIALALGRHSHGKTNNVIDATLTENTTTTTITDARIGATTALLFMPKTANAAAIVDTVYVADSGRVNGSAVVTHANDANTDKDFKVILVG